MTESASEPESTIPVATSSKAVMAFIFGLASFVGVCFTALPAMFLALFALRDINQSNGRLAGQGLAELAMLLAVVGSVTGISLAILLMPGGWLNPLPPSLANQMNLRSLGQAMQSFVEEKQQLPPVGSLEPDGQLVRYCWRVALLPQLGETGLYRKFRLDEPWDSPHNAAYLDYMPTVYELPGQEQAKAGETYYRVVAGKKTLFASYPGENVDWSSVRENADATALIVVAQESVPWTQPEPLLYAADAPLPKLGEHYDQASLLTADFQVRVLPPDCDLSTWRSLLETDADKRSLRSLLSTALQR